MNSVLCLILFIVCFGSISCSNSSSLCNEWEYKHPHTGNSYVDQEIDRLTKHYLSLSCCGKVDYVDSVVVYMFHGGVRPLYWCHRSTGILQMLNVIEIESSLFGQYSEAELVVTGYEYNQLKNDVKMWKSYFNCADKEQVDKM